MTRHDPGSRYSSVTSSSTDSARSSITAKPLPATPTVQSPSPTAPDFPDPRHHREQRVASSTNHIAFDLNYMYPTRSLSRRAPPTRLKSGENRPPGAAKPSSRDAADPPQLSPTSKTDPAAAGGTSPALTPATAAASSLLRDHPHLSELTSYRRDLAILEPAGGPTPQHDPLNNPSSGSLTQQTTPWQNSSSSSSSTSNGGGPAVNVGAKGVGGTGSANGRAVGLVIKSLNTRVKEAASEAAGKGGRGDELGHEASHLDGVHSTSFYHDDSDTVSNPSPVSPSIMYMGQSLPSVPGLTPALSTSSTVVLDATPDAPLFPPDDERRPSVASIATTVSSQGSKASGTTRVGSYKKLAQIFGDEFVQRDSSETSLPISLHGSSKDRSHSLGLAGRPLHRDRNYSNATDHARDASPASSRPRTPVPPAEVVPFLYQEADDIIKYGEAPVRDILSGPDRDRFIVDSTQNPPKTSSSVRSGCHHKHKSNDDPRALRPTVSREEQTVSFSLKDRSVSSNMNVSSHSRAQSPTPSVSGNSRGFKGPLDGPGSPGLSKKGQGGLLQRLRRGVGREKSEVGVRNLPSTPSLASTVTSRGEVSKDGLPPTSAYNSESPGPGASEPGQASRPGFSRHGPSFNPFAKKSRTNKTNEDNEELIGPTDRQQQQKQQKQKQQQQQQQSFDINLDISDMTGIILKKELSMTPVGPDLRAHETNAEPLRSTGPNAGWDAPESWAVRRGDEPHASMAVADEPSTRPEEKLNPHCIRVFRSDGTFATLQMALDSSVMDVTTQIVKKAYITESPENFNILVKKNDLCRVLSSSERPLLLQKRLLQQVGYEDRDRIEDLGREDISYLCRFLFLPARETDCRASSPDFGMSRMQKFNHVDLSARNLITIPVPLYGKSQEIISLNLSRNLSLDVPGDFIQACNNLRDVKFNNNEARKLPLSLSRASKLTYLDVSNNRIEQLEHAELSGLTGLLKLNLANNRLKHLPTYFGAYGALRTLNVSSNFLESFPSFLCELEAIVEMDLSFNLIASLPSDIGRLRNLEKLVITNNRLTGSLPESIKNLGNMRELDIKYNTIMGIDAVSELPKLEVLAADHNSISLFAGSFKRLRMLRLNSNPMAKFEIKAPVPTLKYLNLSHCQLASIDECFNNMPSLERLMLDHNYVVSLPAQIGNLKKLEVLTLSDNVLAELPAEIGCLSELKILDVHGNNIRKLPSELWWASKLETLNVSSNVLESFPRASSRPPQAPGAATLTPSALGAKNGPSSTGPLSRELSSEDLGAESRRPSQASSTLLSVGPSPVPTADRKGSLVSVYGKGGRKTSVISRSATTSNTTVPTPTSAGRKDSDHSQRLPNTFAGSLKNLYMADNHLLDYDVFDQLILLDQLRVLNLAYNGFTDMPHSSIKSWPHLVELYLSGNDLTTFPGEDFNDKTLLQVLHINGNKFINLPAEISQAKRLAVLDCGTNYLKYNIANVPYDWNWNQNKSLRYLNLSGNRKLEIKSRPPSTHHNENETEWADFHKLTNLRTLGLMDVTVRDGGKDHAIIPDQNEDRRVRTSGSQAGFLPYGMADTLGKNEHLSTMDLVVPRFDSSDMETLLGLFDGQSTSSGGSKIAKFLHENFGQLFAHELKNLKPWLVETPEDALRRTFLLLNKDLATIANQHSGVKFSIPYHGNMILTPVVLSKEDLSSGGVATVAYLKDDELFVANVGDVQAMLISKQSFKMLTKKHDPADPIERSRIREAGGWVSRNGRLNDTLHVSRSFGYTDLLPAVQAAPHISHTKITDEAEMILIATRELWEYLKPTLIVDIARGDREDLMRATAKLRDLAMAYGSTNKIMVMMMSVDALKRRYERSRMHRGQSMSWVQKPADDAINLGMRRTKKAREGPTLDPNLNRLPVEIEAPTGLITVCFTDIKNSTHLWETYPEAMRSAIKLHNDVMRRTLRSIGGYEVKTEGDAFMVSFRTATSALLWAFSVQKVLLETEWPAEILNSVHCQEIRDREGNVIFKGLSVRMGIHWGEPLSEQDVVTRRMDYFGPMVNKASRISAVADGGQITTSADFTAEIQRILETYRGDLPQGSTDPDDSATGGGGDSGGEGGGGGVDLTDKIKDELRQLTAQGFEVKDLGERKLKGLENPEHIYSLYLHSLSGRITRHAEHERLQAALAEGGGGGGRELVGGIMGGGGGNIVLDENGLEAITEAENGGGHESGTAHQALIRLAGVSAAPDSDISHAASSLMRSFPLTGVSALKQLATLQPDAVWALWRVSLRLEMLCSSLEDVGGRGLQPPETQLLERMRQRAFEASEQFVMNFLEHQVSRIETCVSTIAIRHLFAGRKSLTQLNDLRAPMSDVLSGLAAQLGELERYKERFGPVV